MDFIKRQVSLSHLSKKVYITLYQPIKKVSHFSPKSLVLSKKIYVLLDLTNRQGDPTHISNLQSVLFTHIALQTFHEIRDWKWSNYLPGFRKF
jgi:hypothetical protein